MEIKQLNCSACGAPISVPDDVDHINCAACGSFLSIQRGEGYIALKMVEKVTETIKDEAFATQTELKRLQITQEISMVELRLSQVRSEIRKLEREKSGKKARRQLGDLYMQEYQILDRMRQLQNSKLALECDEPSDEPRVIQTQLRFIQAELQALKKSQQTNKDARTKIRELRSQESSLSRRLEGVKIKRLKSELKSYQLDLDSEKQKNIQEVKEQYSIIQKDIRTLEKKPKTSETKRVLSDLRLKQNDLYKLWQQLEQERLRSALQSLNIVPPFSQDIGTIHAQLSTVHLDIQTLEAWEENSESKAFLKDLRRKEKKLSRHLSKLQRGADGGGLAELLAGFGLGAIMVTLFQPIKNLFSPEKAESRTAMDDVVKTPSDTIGEVDISEEGINGIEDVGSHSTPTSFLRSAIIGFIPFIGLSCLSFFLFGMFFSDQPDGSYAGTGAFLLGVFISYVIGTWVFYRTLFHNNLWQIVFKNTNSEKLAPSENLGDSISMDIEPSYSRTLIAAMLGITSLVGILLLSMSVSMILDTYGDSGMWLFAVGICLGPLIAILLIFMVFKPEAKIWQPIRNYLSS
jgi:hypothetical protein